MEPDPVPKEVAATRIVLETRTPAPTPTPKPRATPALVQSVAAPRARRVAIHTGGSPSTPKLEVRTQKVVHHKESLPSWWSAMHGSKTVASTGLAMQTTPGPAASAGTGTGSGNGTGSATGPGGGTGGNGTGVANTTAPCGSPVFYRIHAQYNPKDGSFDDTIQVKLTLGNGQVLQGNFPYTWHYASEADDPFSPRTQVSADDPVDAQLPPPGFDASKEPTAVRLTLEKTLPNGTTLFDRCPPGVGNDL